MEIIDFNRKGNVIRFYLGKNGKQWGDDWNDVPYEHNAGKVYDEFIKGYCDIAVDFDYKVSEPYEFPIVVDEEFKYPKSELVKRKIFALTIQDDKEEEKLCDIYFGDKIEDILKLSYVKLLKKGDWING